jgi:hypothetical protein
MQPLIQNYGSTKTFVQTNGEKHMNNIDWKLKYDGNNVRGKVNVKNDKDSKHYKINMDNNDLAQLLNMPKYKKPIHKRLEDDLFFLNDDNDDVYDSSQMKQQLFQEIEPMPKLIPPPMQEIIIPLNELMHNDGYDNYNDDYDDSSSAITPVSVMPSSMSEFIEPIKPINYAPYKIQVFKKYRDSYPLNYARIINRKTKKRARTHLMRSRSRTHSPRKIQKVYHIKMKHLSPTKKYKSSGYRKTQSRRRSKNTKSSLLPLTSINN